MQELIFSPPVVFIIVFLFACLLSYLFSKLAYRGKDRVSGAGKAYACGEDVEVEDHMAQPDYSQFFPFAFFFTLAHVATMMVTAIPLETVASLVMAELYIVSVIVGLFILLRK